MKFLKLYENFEDFDETWIDDEPSNEYRKHKLPTILYNFLKKNKVLDQFISNFEKQHHPSRIFYDYILIHNNSIHLSSLIGSAFIWSYTPEGNKFWREVDQKWKNLILTRNFLDKNLDKQLRNLKPNELYENFEDFEETWIEDPYENTEIKIGDKIIITDKLENYIYDYDWPEEMHDLINKVYVILNIDHMTDTHDDRIKTYHIEDKFNEKWYIPEDCVKRTD